MSDPVDPVKTSVITYDNFTEFQHRLHSASDDEETIPSKFFTEIRKTSRSSHVPCPLTRTSESNLIIYTATSKFDYLLHTYLATTLPAVRVQEKWKDRVEICWTRNPFHNIINHGVLKFDGDSGAEIPGGWLDVHAQFFMKSGARFDQHYNYMIGNASCLVNWSQYLPEFPISSPQPWYYSEIVSNAIPLFLCSMGGVSHAYDFRLQLKELLRMRCKLKDGRWHNIKFNSSYITTNSIKVPTPVMIGRYTKISPPEIEWHKEKSNTHEIVATTVMHFGTKNPSAAGEDVSIKIHTNTPVRALFFVAECQLARELNNRSNYTTNPHNSRMGFNPIKRITHTYNSKAALIQKGYQADRTEPWYYALSAPEEIGYGMFSHGYKPGGLSADIGLTYTQKLGAELHFHINSSNPLYSESALDGPDEGEVIDDILEKAVQRSTKKIVGKDEHYYLHVYSLTCNIINFTNDQKKKVEIDNGSSDNMLLGSTSPNGL
uniref:Major capsid protein n=1 Tax=Pithovirus LCPAC202 TaxID=2506592 RepID=A0A481Z7N2_9VIRU|nr:MAG: major capsid protein [Pithovirus LCPAC202]